MITLYLGCGIAMAEAARELGITIDGGRACRFSPTQILQRNRPVTRIGLGTLWHLPENWAVVTDLRRGRIPEVCDGTGLIENHTTGARGPHRHCRDHTPLPRSQDPDGGARPGSDP